MWPHKEKPHAGDTLKCLYAATLIPSCWCTPSPLTVFKQNWNIGSGEWAGLRSVLTKAIFTPFEQIQLLFSPPHLRFLDSTSKLAGSIVCVLLRFLRQCYRQLLWKLWQECISGKPVPESGPAHLILMKPLSSSSF